MIQSHSIDETNELHDIKNEMEQELKGHYMRTRKFKNKKQSKFIVFLILQLFYNTIPKSLHQILLWF
jgi:hypothetical protein